jgi:cytochrome c-type biogenesis protein CcmF
VVAFSGNMPQQMTSRVLGVLGLISAGFALFILMTSNPFTRLWPAAPDGRDLNPLLQDPALVIHPPMLYTGYVGFSVPFAFAVAAMLEGKLDSVWARWVRPWATVAWMFLTIGIALGSWWAYYELGWGGWWFWDPVENASFMPWLIGTALIHSLAVTETRGLLDTAAVDYRVLAVAAGHVPGALGRDRIGACVRERSQPRLVHSHVPRRVRRRRFDSLFLACAAVSLEGRLRTGVA